ncbi:hypothetical protein SAMN06265379_11816 [Saccharicrinis carchari]|uniref:Uncharacterized protein n=1 Tax=Saccharicrinis carchari TaxID=1168039 RepID=A0A521FAA1_SACCC|nr:hypothetical protein SAMN06265379_11816 [Saccharicrinis carchari]
MIKFAVKKAVVSQKKHNLVSLEMNAPISRAKFAQLLNPLLHPFV